MSTPRKSVQSAQGYEIPLYIDDYRLKLDINENVMGPSPTVIEALRNIKEEDIKFYPAYGGLLEKLASYNKVKSSMILPANGADESISYVFDTFVECNDSVLTVTPSFLMPKVYAKTLGCNYKEIPYTEKWVFPADELIKNIDGTTKLIIITSPNNPTGEAIEEATLLKILNAAKNSYVLIDETYVNYAERSFADLVSKYPNVLIARSMSKDFALAGLRFGYLIAHEENINYVKKVIRPYCVNNLANIAASAALDDIQYLNNAVKEIKQAREMLRDGLKPYAEKVYDSNANFLLCDFGDRADFIYKKLLKSGIKIKHFGKTPNLENHLRISVPSIKDTEFILETLRPRDLIIFDMDGVLADTSNSYSSAIKGVYEEFSGKKLTEEDIQQARKRGGLNCDWTLTHFLLERDGINVTFDKMIEKFQQLYVGDNWNGYILNERLLLSKSSIAGLAEKYDLAVFTGRPKPEAEFFLKHHGLDKYFEPVITMDDVPRGRQKPDPWGVLEILRVIKPNKVYYLGDTVDDMFAAKQAGVTGIGVLPPQEKSEELIRALKAHGAAEILKQTEDIIGLMESLDKISK